MPKKKSRGFFASIFHGIGVLFGAVWIVIKYLLQIINIFVDRFLKYLNIVIVWIGRNIFHISKKAVKMKSKEDTDKTASVNDSKKEKDAESEEKVHPASKGRISHDPVFEDFTVIEEKKGSYDKFEDRLFNTKSMIGIILGARGTGKSAIGMKLLENIHSKAQRPVSAMGFRSKDLPKWISVVDSVSQIENGSFVLVDEGGILFSSRSAMSAPNKLLSELLLIARHKDLSILFITQNSSNLEVNTIRQADYLILKPSSLLQRDFERNKIRDIYDEASEDFERYKDDKGLAYIYGHNFKGFISNPLPSFWNEKVSKAFSS